MSHESVTEYLAEVKRLQTLHADRIHLYAAAGNRLSRTGMGPLPPTISAIFRSTTCIGSVHFVPSDSGYVDVDGRFESFREKMSTYFHDDIRYVVDTFYDQSERMILEGGFDMDRTLRQDRTQRVDVQAGHRGRILVPGPHRLTTNRPDNRQRHHRRDKHQDT